VGAHPYDGEAATMEPRKAPIAELGWDHPLLRDTRCAYRFLGLTDESDCDSFLVLGKMIFEMRDGLGSSVERSASRAV
jgi:hypothetical protein